MIIIQTKHQHVNYVVGVFADSVKAFNYFETLDNDKFELSAINFSYPIVIIERLINDINKFDFYQHMGKIDLQDNEITQYIVNSDFIPDELGEDEMGKLYHIHIEADVE